MTFADLDLPFMPGGIGLWKSTETIQNEDWGTAEDALCTRAQPVIEDKRNQVGGYYCTKNEQTKRLSLYLMRRPR